MPARRASGRGRVGGHPEYAGEIVAAPARNEGERRITTLEHARQRAQQAVAAHGRHGLLLICRAAGFLGGVLDAAGDHRTVLRPEAVELGVHGGQRLQRPTPGRGRVDQQRKAPAHSAVAAARARSAAAAPRSSPRRWALLSTLLDVGCGEQLVADQARRGGSSRSSGSSTSSTSCWTVCQRSPVTRSEATRSWPGRWSQCRSNRPRR